MIKEMKYWLDEHTQNIQYIKKLAVTSAVSDTQSTTLGMWWDVIRDVIFFITYSFFMLVVRGRGSGGELMDGIPTFVYLFTGLAAWYLISDYLTNAVGCMVKNKGIYTKIKFPIMIIPTYEVLAIFIRRLITFGIVTVLLIFVTLTSDYVPHINIFGLVYSIVASIAFGIAYTLFMSGFYTISKDFRELYRAIVRIQFYFIPIFWSIHSLPGGNRLPEWTAKVLENLPFIHLINTFRYAISLGQFPPLLNVGIFLIWLFVLFAVGCYLQYRLQRIYADFV